MIVGENGTEDAVLDVGSSSLGPGADVSGRGREGGVDLGTEFDVSTGTDAAIERCWHPSRELHETT